MKVAILSGSSRSNSSSLRVSRALSRLFRDRGAEVRLINFEQYDIPFFNGGDIDQFSLTSFQKELVGAMDECKSIIFVTPEYNWFPSAELVNMIHRLGDDPFGHLWDKKVFSFVGVSTGRGGRMPTVQLGYVVDKLINVFGFSSVTNPKSFEVQFAKRVLDENGDSLGSEEFDKGIGVFVDYSLKLAEHW